MQIKKNQKKNQMFTIYKKVRTNLAKMNTAPLKQIYEIRMFFVIHNVQALE